MGAAHGPHGWHVLHGVAAHGPAWPHEPHGMQRVGPHGRMGCSAWAPCRPPHLRSARVQVMDWRAAILEPAQQVVRAT
eukprot:155574-Chlamydomonas_euryale.AAC.1